MAEVSVAHCKQSITTVFLVLDHMRLKTRECFVLTHFPVSIASVIESDHDSISVGCGLITMTPQSSFWKDHDSGQGATVTVQLFAVVKHLHSSSQANPGNHCG